MYMCTCTAESNFVTLKRTRSLSLFSKTVRIMRKFDVQLGSKYTNIDCFYSHCRAFFSGCAYF